MASGDTLQVFNPDQNEPPLTDFATRDSRNNRPCLDFDVTTSESAIFTGFMPRIYAGSGITVNLEVATTVTTGDMDWDVSIERVGTVQNLDSDGFAAVQSTDGTTVPGVSGDAAIIAVTFTDGSQMDSLAAGEMFRIKVARDTADTAAADLELYQVEIKET